MEFLLNEPVLVLNRLWQPLQVCSVRRAIKLLCTGHAQVVQTEGEEQYQTHDLESWLTYSTDNLIEEMIHSVSLLMRVPKIIVLSVFDKIPKRKVKFTRQNIFQRDNYLCQYCGKKFIEKELNLDHVNPRDKGGKTTWENIVTSCIGCNTRKSNKLPHEANMFPMKEPKRPRWRPAFGTEYDKEPKKEWQNFVSAANGAVRISA